MPFTDENIQQAYLDTYDELCHFLKKRIGCFDTATDLSQEIFFRLPLISPRPNNALQVRAWLFTVAANLSMDHIRSQKRRNELLEQYYGGATEVDDSSMPEQIVMAIEELDRLHRAIGKLSDQCAQVLYLSRIDGFTHPVIASQMGISKSLVEKLIMRAVNHCRLVINEERC